MKRSGKNNGNRRAFGAGANTALKNKRGPKKTRTKKVYFRAGKKI